MTEATGDVVAIGRRDRRRLGVVLTAYGTAGVLVVLLGGGVVLGSLAGVNGLTDTLETERSAIIDTMNAATDTLDGAATSTRGFATSLEGTRRTAADGAGLTRDFATTLDQASATMDVSILGTQPFASVAAGFRHTAEQSRALADELDAAAITLDRNVEDVRVLSDRIATLRGSMADLRDSLRAAGPFENPMGPSAVVLLALLGWLLLPAVASLAMGVRLLRPAVVSGATVVVEPPAGATVIVEPAAGATVGRVGTVRTVDTIRTGERADDGADARADDRAREGGGSSA